MTYPPFSLDRQRYDQSTYFGRVQRCFSIVDPSTLFVSSKKLADSMALLNDFNEGTLPAGVTDAQLWKARKIKEAIIHPDTGEKILMPFRMSGCSEGTAGYNVNKTGYVPFGTVSVIGMLIPGASVKQVIFWQWLNQTHNACVNYSNRNATKPTPTTRFVMSYVGAVTSAVGIAVGISMLIRKTSVLSAGQKLLASRFVAYPATSAANVCNVYMMRRNELQEGVDVEDENGNVVGSSKIAASKAVYETAISRVLLPAPILIFPPLIMAWLEKTKTFRRNPRLNMPINAAVCTLAFGLALPFAIAMFPQKTKADIIFVDGNHLHLDDSKKMETKAEIEVSKLEAEISSKTSSGVVYFNKGL